MNPAAMVGMLRFAHPTNLNGFFMVVASRLNRDVLRIAWVSNLNVVTVMQ